MIRAIFFDLDGVLVDAADLHYEALNRALRHMADYEISREDHLGRFNGLPTRDKLSLLIEDGAVEPGQYTAIANLKQEFTVELASAHIRPDPVKVHMCAELAKKYHLVVVSNCVKQSVELLLRLAGIRNYFWRCYSNQDVKLAKPHPMIYLHALKQVQCAARSVLAIEDHPRGLEAARGAGIVAVQLQYHQVTYDAILDAISVAEAIRR